MWNCRPNTRRYLSRPARAFTLVEVLVTLVIVGVLTASSLGLVARLSKRQIALQQSGRRDDVAAGLRRLVELDLQHADRYRVLSDGFEIEARSTVAAETMALSHLPATIRYRIETIGPRPWLVRTQRGGDKDVFRELVCSGVAKISVSGLQSGGAGQGGWLITPPALRVKAEYRIDSGTKTLDFSVFLR
jgi:prepilin-type N-terminal cleavage/methylation domain-containing protein